MTAKGQTTLCDFEKGDFTVSIIGLGYVGLPLALLFAKRGIKVVGIDVSEKRVNDLNIGKIPFNHLNTTENRDILLGSRFKASTSYDHLSNVDVIVICVPTPITSHLEPDLSFVLDACKEISNYLKCGHTVILESTTYPGTTDELVAPIIEETGLIIGETVYLGYSPEREDPANKDYVTKDIPKIVSGCSPNCLSMVSAIYKHVISKVIPVTSTRVAEITKLVENIHRSVNIGLMNELKPLCAKIGIDIFEVIEAASTKPFGFTPFYPGPGLGGHCIPIDPFYLSWKAKEFGIRTRFIELAGEINTYMPNYVVSKVSEILNSHKKCINGATVLILGVAYKRNIEDIRSSPSIEILEQLIDLGAHVRYSDDYVPALELGRKIYNSLPLTDLLLSESDITLLLTDHDSFDYSLIHRHAAIIIDTRGRFATNEKVIRA